MGKVYKVGSNWRLPLWDVDADADAGIIGMADGRWQMAD